MGPGSNRISDIMYAVSLLYIARGLDYHTRSHTSL